MMTLRNFSNPAFGLKADGVLGNRLGYHGKALYAPWNIMEQNNKLLNQGDELLRELYFETGADLFLASWTRADKGEFRITTSNDGFTERYFIAKTDLRKTFGIRAGALMYTINRFFTEEEINGKPIPEETSTKVFQNVAMIGGYAGLTFRKFKKAKITTKGGTYYRNRQRIFYMDFMTAGATYGTFHYKGQSYQPKSNVDNLGYRMGFQWDKQGMITNWEFGKQPGPIAANASEEAQYFNYMNFGFSFTLFGGDRRYAMR